MKRLLIFMLVVGAVMPAAAQDWKEVMKNVVSNVADKATGGKATEALMVGTWRYTAPGVKLESDNALADVGASAVTGKVEKQLERLYQLAGIREGACRFTFGSDKRFTAVFGSRTLGGTYEFVGESHDITLHFERSSNGRKIGTLKGKCYLAGSDLQLLLPMTGLLKIVDAVGEQLASVNASAKTLSALVGKFDNLYLGFEFTKE